MPNYASKLGEAVGHLIEAEMQRIVRAAVTPLGCHVDTGGPRPGRRTGTKVLLVNDTGNKYQIDTVVEDAQGNPIALIECKYIRYKKHNRDKASWTCVAHYKLRTTYPTIRRSIAVLVGDWTAPSKRLMQSFGIQIVEIPFLRLVEALEHYEIPFKWNEGDAIVPQAGVRAFLRLAEEEKSDIALRCLAGASDSLTRLVCEAVSGTEPVSRNVTQVELLLKTNQDEYVLRKFNDPSDAIGYLAGLTTQKADIGNIVARREGRA